MNKNIKFRIFLVSLIFLAGQAAAAADVIVTPSTKTVIQGQTFNLNISVDPRGTAIAGAQLNIGFNKSVININGIIEGNLFKQNGTNTFFNNGTINNSLGTVVSIFDVILGSYSVSTPGTFIVINATAVGVSGTSGINLSSVMFSDPNGVEVAANVANESVTINSQPTLAAIGNKTVNVGQTLIFTISATDADGDFLSYSASNLPAGALFSPASQTFQWTPTFTQSGIYPNVHFEVSDGTLTDFENITITVKNIKKKR